MSYKPKNYCEEWDAFVKEYGEPKYRPVSGYKWVGSLLYVKSSVHGARYLCPWCGFSALGIGRKNHLSNCVVVKQQSEG